MRSVLFNIGPLAIPSYGCMLLVAYLLCLWMALRLADREGLDRMALFELSLELLAGAVGGAWITLALSDFRHPSRLLHPLDMPLSLGGALLAAVGVSVWFCRRRGLDWWSVADLGAPCLGLGLAVSRIGCFLGGCCYGSVTSLSWGVCLPGQDEIRHPAPLYEMPLDLLIAAILFCRLPHRRFRGEIFLGFLLLYGLGRLACECFRDSHPWWIGLSTPQYSSIACILFAAAGLWMARPGRQLPPVIHKD